MGITRIEWAGSPMRWVMANEIARVCSDHGRPVYQLEHESNRSWVMDMFYFAADFNDSQFAI